VSRRHFYSLAAVVLFATGFYCGEDAQVKLGEPFELGAGQKVWVGGELTVTFAEVVQDSRCPKGEQCITAGKAVVRLEVIPRDGTAVQVRLETGGAASEAGEAEVPGFRIILQDLSPYPSVKRPIIFQDYLSKLTVHRL